jgi:hypothetical protein
VLSSLRSQRNVSGLSVVLSIAIGMVGCGGKAAVKADTSARARVAKSAPAYRVGQYCVASRDAKYRAAGLACKKHHLARR